MSGVEAYTPVNGSAGNSAPTGGRRRRSQRKLRLVKKSTVRRMLKSKGLKMRGGDPGAPPAGDGQSAGRRRRGRKTRGRRRSLFGMKY